MQKIVPHFWFDKLSDIKEATQLYTSLFPNSSIIHTTTITNTPSGDCDIVNFKLADQDFMAINAGPVFQLNPSISMFVVFDNQDEIKQVWDKLIKGGKALMEFDTYPWADKYGWLQDKWGLSWQLSMSKNHHMAQKITPALMYTQTMSGKTKEALEHYTSIFPDSKIDMLVPYEEGEGDTPGFIKHSRFTLAGQQFIAMDSSADHKFIFSEAISLIVNCDTQDEIDMYWQKLSAVPEAEQCGWLKDKYGVSWQIVPTAMGKMMKTGTPEQVARVTEAFLPMKKFDIAALEKAFQGE